MTVEPHGETAKITLDARSRTGGFLNSYQIEANIISPNGEAQSVTFMQTAPGRYESEFIPKEQGIYLIRFSGTTDTENGSASFAETTGWALSYSPEYQRIDPNPDLLLRLSALANGQVASPLPADVFTHDLKATRASQPISPLLLLIAALLLPIDIAARRLILTRQDFQRGREWLAQKLFTRQITQTQLAQANPRMEALFNAKSRIREATPVQEKITEETVLPKEHRDNVSNVEEEKETPSVPKPEQPPSTTSALLARKKNLRK
jgi:hypothetical protein